MPNEPSVRVGSLEIVPLLDGSAPLPLDEELLGRPVDWRAEGARFPWLLASATHWAWHVRAFLVRSEHGRILVDTGIGHLGRPPYDVDGRIEDSLADAGTSAAAIDHVVLTHLHADHAGGTCRPDGSARFPNAVHHVHDADWRFFADAVDEGFEGRSAMTVLEGSGRLALSAIDHTVAPGIRVVHAPGHTPGHRCVLVGDDAERLLLTGDLLHVPVQVAHPEWRSTHDVDPQLGVASRRIQLFRARSLGWRVGVSHFGRPFGRVGDEGWEPDPAGTSPPGPGLG